MAAEPTLDRIDRRILVALQADGRLTNQALSEQVALSPSACLARVRRLEQIGIIQGYHARIDPLRVHAGLVLYVEVTLKEHSPKDHGLFEEYLRALPQVVEASHVTGAYDYLLKVAVSDMPEWTALADRLTSAEIGVDRLVTHVMMGKPKFFVGYPVGNL